MIRKSEIIDAMNSINHDLLMLSVKVSDLNREVQAIKVQINKSGKSDKADKAKKQARDKSGKFVKK